MYELCAVLFNSWRALCVVSVLYLHCLECIVGLMCIVHLVGLVCALMPQCRICAVCLVGISCWCLVGNVL